MRSAIIYSLLLSFVLIQGCGNKNNVFVKHTDVEEAGLKGRVKSIVMYQCSLGDSVEHCSIYRKKFNAQGFLIEKLDTSGSDFSSRKYFYNNDGLLAKVMFSSNDPFLGANDTYYQYFFSECKKTVVRRHGTILIDSVALLYDKNGNQIEFTTGDIKTINKYDQHGFLVWSKLTRPSDIMEFKYINDDKGRILKTTRSDGIVQAFVYDKDGNQIQETDIDPKGKATDYLTGYCEFDKNGNFLKRITVCKQKKEAFMDRRVIEYY